MTTSPVNVASHLVRLAAAEPTRAAIHVPRGAVRYDGPSEYTTLTFAELNADSDAIAHGLVKAGITRGTRTVLMVPPSIDVFSLTFALLKVGAIPVLIDPGMGIKNLAKCLADAEPEAFIGIPKAHFARRLLRWAKQSIRTTVNVGTGRFFCQHSLRSIRDSGLSHGSFPIPDQSCDDTAAILFTSGSTGIAKGVVYMHGIFAAQVEMLKSTYGIEPGEVDLCTFPLFALFGPALGMTCVVPDMDPSRPARIDPRKVAAQVKQFGVTNLFGSPAVIRRLGQLTSDNAPSLTTLRRVISAGAPATPAALDELTKIIPRDVEIYTPYGATESLPVANIGSREILRETQHLTALGRGVCIGRVVEGMQVYVIPISDEPIAEWDESSCLPSFEIGEFVVRGPVVTCEYFRRPDATKLAKIRDARTGEILHRMGDVGYWDEEGRLWFCGRKSHRVVTPWGTLFTDQVEPIFNSIPGVFHSALVGVKRDGVVYPVLCWERYDTAVTSDTLWSLGCRFIHTNPVYTFLLHPGFPMDVRHNSKIFREKLAVWADRKLGEKWRPANAIGAAP